MRTQLAVMLSILSISIIFSGCCQKCPTVPQRCIVELPSEPIIDNESCGGDVKCTVEKNLKNYEAQKLYAETLKNNAGVCR